MNAILTDYAVNDPTWFYLSFLLLVGVFFRFSRLWAVRNFDLLSLLLITPGLLLVRRNAPVLGYTWLFVISAVWLTRLLLDGLLHRRPRIEPNMNAAGLAFLCASAVLFLTIKVVHDPLPAATVDSVRMADRILDGQSPPVETSPAATNTGPVPSLLAAPVVLTSRALAGTSEQEAGSDWIEQFTARSIAILSHLSVILGLWAIGARIFGDSNTGIAMATLYMLHPCTAFDVQKVHHVLPAALTLWAIRFYRRPIIAGTCLGLACGTMFFPVFLLPIWASFYGRRGMFRFGTAVAATAITVCLSLALASGDAAGLTRQYLGYFDWSELQFKVVDAAPGFWNNFESAYRIPVIVTFLLMLVTLTFWPGRKSLTQLIGRSAAIIVATQFWYSDQGGIYVLWYLPLVLLVIFRPVLDHHTFLPPEIMAAQTARTEAALATATHAAGISPGSSGAARFPVGRIGSQFR